MNAAAQSDARGFSLIELTVALAVTLIVTGAIYGLLTGGQSAFRREPELSDRQQNIRVAMDLIMKDIGNAGSGLPPFVQIFTRTLDACSGCPNGGAPMGLGGVLTDELEMLTNDGRDNEPVCATTGSGNSANIRLVRNAPPLSGPILIMFADGTWTMMNITDTSIDNTGESNCTAGSDKTKLNFNSGAGDTSGMNVPGGTCQPNAYGVGNAGPPPAGASITNCPGEPVGPGPCCTANQVGFSQLVRYRIRNDAAGVPELQRSNSANFAAGFQTVARGIEDLQVQYTQADGTVTAGGPGAPQVLTNVWASLTTQVRVTLSSRSEARNIQGATADANLGTRVRGSLTYTGAPRSTLIGLSNQGGGTLWR